MCSGRARIVIMRDAHRLRCIIFAMGKRQNDVDAITRERCMTRHELETNLVCPVRLQQDAMHGLAARRYGVHQFGGSDKPGARCWRKDDKV